MATEAAPLLPLDVPVPVAQGSPTAAYPWYWDVYRWSTAKPRRSMRSTRSRLRATWASSSQRSRRRSAGAPQGRGIPLAQRDREIRQWLTRFDDSTGDRRVGARALGSSVGRAAGLVPRWTSTSATGSFGLGGSAA